MAPCGHHRSTTFAVLAPALLAAASARAELGEAVLEVRLSVPDPAAVVRLRPLEDAAPAPAGPERTTPVKGALARFTRLPPGRYQVAIERVGFAPLTAGVWLGADEVVSLRAELAPARGIAPALAVVDRHRLVVGAVFDGDLLRDLPSSGSLWSPLETAEATAITNRIEGGGLHAGEPALLGIHGSSWTQTQYRLWDLDVGDPDRLGTPLLHLGLDALGGLDVVSGLMPADVGGPGAVLALGPARPPTTWRGAVQAQAIPGGPQSEPSGGAPAIARFDSFWSGSVLVGGPLAKERVGLLLMGSLVRARRFERADPAPLEGQAASFLGHLVFTPSTSDEVRLLGSFQGLDRPDTGRARFARRDVQESDRLLDLLATWERRRSGGLSLSAGYTRGRLEPTPAEAIGPPVERLRDGPLPDLFPARALRERWQLAARLEPALGARAEAHHALRLGASAAWSRAVSEPPGPRVLTPETVDGLPARVWDYGWAGPESRRHATELAAYASDAMSYGRLSLEAGLRFDAASASAAGADGGIDWKDLSPRLAARLRLDRAGRLALLAGWSRYAHRLPLGLVGFGDPAGPQGVVYRWQDRDGNGRFDAGEAGPLVARVGPGSSVASIDPGLKRPRTEEVAVGLEGGLGGSWRARLFAIHRRERELVASVNVGVPASAYTVRLVPDPAGDILDPADDQQLPISDRRPESFGQDRYLLTNPAGENALYEGVELAVAGSVAGRLRLELGATASRAVGPAANRGFRAGENDQGLVGERLETPNATTFSRGRLFFDRAYTIKVAAAYRAPGDLRVGAVARYQDGQPFARVVVAPDLGPGPEAVQAIPNGRSRFTYTLTLDARVEKGFPIGRGRLAAVLEAFNLLDAANEVEEDVTTGASFRAVSAVQPPRTVRVGVRLDF